MTRESWRQLGRITLRVYGFPAVMLLGAFVPVVNLVLYSTHGGIGWLVLPLVFPFVLFQLFMVWKGELLGESSKKFAALSLAAYFPVTLGGSIVGARLLESWFGYKLSGWFLWGFFIFPLGLHFNGKFFGL